jgi:hypothetical protein
MQYKHSVIVLALAIAISSCQPRSGIKSTNKPSASQQAMQQDLTLSPTVFISIDSANKMLSSYLASIVDSTNQLYALFMNADSIRAYCADTSIHQLKLMLAHTLPYINAGNQGKWAQYQIEALTLIIAGVNNAGNYVAYWNATVPNEAVPCPRNCLTTGTASSNLISIAP